MKPRYETTKIHHQKYETESTKPRMKARHETSSFEGLKRMISHTFGKTIPKTSRTAEHVPENMGSLHGQCRGYWQNTTVRFVLVTKPHPMCLNSRSLCTPRTRSDGGPSGPFRPHPQVGDSLLALGTPTPGDGCSLVAPPSGPHALRRSSHSSQNCALNWRRS